jgi:hypothetical protein
MKTQGKEVFFFEKKNQKTFVLCWQHFVHRFELDAGRN